MNILHVLLVILYVGGTILFRPLVSQRLPTAGAEFVPLYRRPWIALVWLWSPVWWFLPGILWMRVFEGFPIGYLMALSLLLPISWMLLFLWYYGMLGFASYSAVLVKAVSAVLVGGTLLITMAVILAGLLEETITGTQLAVYIGTCLWGPVLLTLLLIAWSREVVPLPGTIPNASSQALKMILGYFTSFPKPTWVVEDGELRTRIAGNPFLGSGPGCLVTEPENLVLLKTAADVTGIAGPGVVLTKAMVTPGQVVDLRNKIRSTVVRAVTRDGIEVSVPVSSLFRVDRGPKTIALGRPWPYRNARTVFHAVSRAEVDPSGLGSHDFHPADPWEDRLLAFASHKAKQAISFYSFDQLYGAPSPSLTPIHISLQDTLGLRPAKPPHDPLLRSTIGKFVQRAVRQAFELEGFEILGGSIGNRIVPLQRDVTDQSVTKWKAAFVTKVMDWETELKEKRLRNVSAGYRARELAVEEITAHSADRLKTWKVENRQNVLAFEVLYTLMSVAQNPEVRKKLPDSAVPTLDRLMRQAAGEHVDGGTQ